MRTRGRIPESAEVRYLREGGAPLDEITWLISKEFGSHPMANLDALLRCSQDPDDHSLYVRVNDELVAAMLFHVEGELAVVDVRVAAKRWRNGWPNLVMLENALSWAKAAALTKARMFCDEGVHDTINLARRGGEMVDVKARFYRYVAARRQPKPRRKCSPSAASASPDLPQIRTEGGRSQHSDSLKLHGFRKH
jgi:hypothetical protein